MSQPREKCTRRAAGCRVLALCLLVLGSPWVFTACVAEQESGHQFANDPPPTEESLTLSAGLPETSTELPPAPTSSANPPDFASLFVARGAPTRIYFRSGEELWTIGADGSDPHRVFAPTVGSAIRAVAASPSGDAVAALVVTATAEEERASVIILDPAGNETRRVDDPGATLGGDEVLTARSLDWSPQGGQLLVSFHPGGLLAIATAGVEPPRVLLDRATAPAPGDAAWSPTGQAVAFLSPTGGAAPANLFIAQVEPTPAAPRSLLSTTDPAQTVTDLAWTPDGQALLFVAGDVSSGAAPDGDLWWIAADGTGRRLIASAGAAAPVAEVVAIRPSPDGRGVAYLIVVPGETGAHFHSMWVSELSTGSAVQIPVATDLSVTALWWTASGLVYRTVPARGVTAGGSSDAFALWRISDATGPIEIFHAAPAIAASPVAPATPPPAATPLAGPETHGAASPAASPLAAPDPPG